MGGGGLGILLELTCHAVSTEADSPTISLCPPMPQTLASISPHASPENCAAGMREENRSRNRDMNRLPRKSANLVQVMPPVSG